MPAPFISLSIVSHGDSEEVLRLLTSLQKYEQETKRFQIILTDNFGNDLQDSESKAWHSVQVLRNDKKLGFAENHNRAFQFATGEYFAILNPDLVFEQPVFMRLIESLEKHSLDIIALKIVDENGVTQDSFRRLPNLFTLIKRRLHVATSEDFVIDQNGIMYPDWIAGMFLFMRSNTYRQLGGMDEKFFLYFEDVDFCTRARLQGMNVAVDTHVQVRHDAQRSSRKSMYYLFLHLRSMMQFFISVVYRKALRNR
ncbi:MAG TPA: hypothetical protein DHW49_02545 [Anaerolineae bacterium]|nr:hypothetical protein [Anaerolineae bacterium]